MKTLNGIVFLETKDIRKSLNIGNQTCLELLIELLRPCLDEQFKLNKIDKSTLKRKTDTLTKLAKANFSSKPIAKVTRDEVVNYLASLSKYSTIFKLLQVPYCICTKI